MSTRSAIGLQLEDESYKTIYCHNDGYLEGVGKTLVDNYKTKEDVEALLELGDISTLGEQPYSDPELWDLDKWASGYWKTTKGCCTYKGRGDKDVDALIFKKLSDIAPNYGAEYIYIFKDGKWFYTTGSTKLKKLTENLNKNIFSKDGNSVTTKSGRVLKVGDKVKDGRYITGFDPDTNTVFLDEDPDTDGGADYSVEDIEDELVESLNEELVQVGDEVTIKGVGNDSPWEGLSGVVTWVDEDEQQDENGEDMTTVTVKINFLTESGDTKMVEQNFDRKNVYIDNEEDEGTHDDYDDINDMDDLYNMKDEEAAEEEHPIDEEYEYDSIDDEEALKNVYPDYVGDPDVVWVYQFPENMNVEEVLKDAVNSGLKVISKEDMENLSDSHDVCIAGTFDQLTEFADSYGYMLNYNYICPIDEFAYVFITA